MKIPIGMIDIENRINKLERRLNKIIPKEKFQNVLNQTEETNRDKSEKLKKEDVNEIINKNVNLKQDIINNQKIKRNKISETIKKISNKYNIDNKLIEAIAEVESSKNQNAISNKGAVGIMQLMPETAKDMGVKNINDLYENIEGGVKYVEFLQKQFGEDIEKVLAAYNSGPSNVKKYNGIPPFSETQNYVKKVLDIYNK